MKRLIVGNWKMNLDVGAASLLVSRLAGKVEAKADTEVVLCPPFIDLAPLARELDRNKFALGAQNVHAQDNGPYTGEVSAAMLKGLVQYTLVGHSERRAMGEHDKDIAAKLAAALRAGITPVLCVGETLTEREHKLSRRVVIDQLTAAVTQLTSADIAKIVVAYEPIWSINHHDGHPVLHATPDQIKFAYEAIRTTLEDLYGDADLSDMRMLYGGSVDPDNATAYLKVAGVSGLLVGSASLNYEDFAAIVRSAQQL